MTQRGKGKVAEGPAPVPALSKREREVIAILAEGLSNQGIAERLFISETTVRHHLTSIFAKLEVSDRLELLIYAYRHGLVDPPRPPDPDKAD
jgi:DNA-binding NarL/FixJ family response regulator